MATRLDAGPALNALVAEKVFGLMIHEGQYDTYVSPQTEPVSGQRPCDHYSTDIAAAWAVNFVMCEKRWDIRDRYLDAIARLAREAAGSVPMRWQVDVIYELRDRMPHAICLAALDALENTEGAVGSPSRERA